MPQPSGNILNPEEDEFIIELTLFRLRRKSKKTLKMDWQKAPDIQEGIEKIVEKLELKYIDPKRIVSFRSTGSSSRARARIWSFPKVWQMALNLPAHYVIEVLSQHYDHLSDDDRTRILIHELLHIPSNFSGSLLPHRGRGKRIDARRVESLFQEMKAKT